jgi:hypothetical protein
VEAIEAIALAGSAGFAIVVVAVIVVIIGVRYEERIGTLTRQHLPTVPSLLARLVLGTYVRLPTGRHNEPDCPNACECPQRGRKGCCAGPNGMARAGHLCWLAQIAATGMDVQPSCDEHDAAV